MTVVGARLAAAFFPSIVGLVFFLPVPGVVRQEVAIPLQGVSALRRSLRWTRWAWRWSGRATRCV